MKKQDKRKIKVIETIDDIIFIIDNNKESNKIINSNKQEQKKIFFV